jgi:Outer membrane lipoprotein-sorting protein
VSRPTLLAAAVFVLAAWTQCAAEGRADPAPGSALRAQEIFDRVTQMNDARTARLVSYVSRRRYSVFEPGHHMDAELVASMVFVAPSTKTFTTVSENGVGWIHKRVFRRLMDAEQEAATGADHVNSAISPANYDVQLVGHDSYQGRDCYVLALLPKRHDKYLLKGKAWIDADDYALAKLEGEPVQSPSFWVVRAPFVRTYQRIDGFWLPLQDETHTQIRFIGEYVLRIVYGDYRITANGVDKASPSTRLPLTPDAAIDGRAAAGPFR